MAHLVKCSKELVERVCELVGTGQSLDKICRENVEWCPPVVTLRMWLFDVKPEHEYWRQAYSMATLVRVESFFDEIEKLEKECHDKLMDIATNQPGSRAGNYIAAHYRQRIEDVKWKIIKMAPRQYGDMQRLELSGDPKNPLQVRFNIPRPQLGEPGQVPVIEPKEVLAIPLQAGTRVEVAE